MKKQKFQEKISRASEWMGTDCKLLASTRNNSRHVTTASREKRWCDSCDSAVMKNWNVSSPTLNCISEFIIASLSISEWGSSTLTGVRWLHEFIRLFRKALIDGGINLLINLNCELKSNNNVLRLICVARSSRMCTICRRSGQDRKHSQLFFTFLNLRQKQLIENDFNTFFYHFSLCGFSHSMLNWRNSLHEQKPVGGRKRSKNIVRSALAPMETRGLDSHQHIVVVLFESMQLFS